MLESSIRQSGGSSSGFVGQGLQPERQKKHNCECHSRDCSAMTEWPRFENKKLLQVIVERFLHFLFRCHFFLHFLIRICFWLRFRLFVTPHGFEALKQVQRVSRTTSSSLCCQHPFNSWSHSLVCWNLRPAPDPSASNFFFFTGIFYAVKNFVDAFGIICGVLQTCAT